MRFLIVALVTVTASAQNKPTKVEVYKYSNGIKQRYAPLITKKDYGDRVDYYRHSNSGIINSTPYMTEDSKGNVWQVNNGIRSAVPSHIVSKPTTNNKSTPTGLYRDEGTFDSTKNITFD